MNHDVKINYQYRDAGNSKLFGSKIFSNKNNLPLDQVENKIKTCLIDGEFFVPEEWRIERLSFEKYIPALDHDWHAFENIEYAEEQGNPEEDIADFLQKIEDQAAK